MKKKRKCIGYKMEAMKILKNGRQYVVGGKVVQHGKLKVKKRVVIFVS